MSQLSVAITKRVAFRDWTQDFANVYTYESTASLPDETGALALIDELTAAEKTWHSTDVSFVLGRCWSSGGSISSNVMLAEKTLTGAGVTSPSTAMDRERAILIQWDAGFDSRGHPVRLKKWYHACGAFAGVTMSNNLLRNTIGFTSAERIAMANLVNPAVRQIGPSNQWVLCSPAGRSVVGDAVAHKYLEHHQLGDNWR